MKTEQEQIEVMAGIIAETLQDKKVENGATWVSYLPSLLGSADKEKEVAEALHEAGYGDVSEYKAEIERLRETLGQCNIELNGALETLKSQCCEIGKPKAEVKQAQIDVLNKLKARSIGYSFLGEKLITESEIDELIKEMQDEKDNG